MPFGQDYLGCPCRDQKVGSVSHSPSCRRGSLGFSPAEYKAAPLALIIQVGFNPNGFTGGQDHWMLRQLWNMLALLVKAAGAPTLTVYFLFSLFPFFLISLFPQADQKFSQLWETWLLLLEAIPECPRNNPTLPGKLNF